MTTRWALQVAYDGTAFRGSQRQPDARTVEGELLDGLREVGAGEDANDLEFMMASRTDRGVSAAGNVLALTTGFPGDALARALDAQVRDAWIVGQAQVPRTFLPRTGGRRRYRYVLPADLAEPEDLADVLARFEGTHDLRAFARLRDDRDPVRTVDAVEVTARDGVLHVDVAGPTFLWNQVRRMVGAAVQVIEGRRSVEDVDAALAGERDPGFPPAPPEHLILLDVTYDDVRFEPVASASLRRARTHAELEAARMRVLGEAASP